MPTFESIQRPERWAVPFSPEMTDADVDRLLSIEPFSSLDPTRFRGKVTLRGILKNDTRLVRCQPGDIVVRQGDWGNSAFLVISGNVRVELGSAASLPSEILGRQRIRRKGLFEIIAQLWNNPTEPEVRDVASYRHDPRIGTRGTGEQTRIYLQDVSSVLNKYNTANIEAGQFFGESRRSRTHAATSDRVCRTVHPIA